jgi:hypothetical protein
MIEKIILSWQSEPPILNQDQLKLVDEVWAARPSHIFNGSLFVCTSKLEQDNTIQLSGAFTEYRYWYAQWALGQDLGIRAAGVSGWTLCEDHVIFGRRSPQTTTYPGWYELVPSGGVDKEAACSDGTVDVIAMLKKELEEETGAPETSVSSARPLTVFYDPELHIYEIVIELMLGLPLNDLLEHMRGSEEYEAPVAVPFQELRDWLAVNEQSLIPMSRTISHWMLEGSGERR